MHQTHRARRRRPGLLLAAGVVSLGLLVAACGDDDDDTTSETTAGTTETTAGTTETTAGGTTETTAGGTTETTEPAGEIKMGGTLRVGVEADTNGWVPAIMQCDSACQIRARSFFEPLMAVDTNLELKGYLAESIEPNDDYTVFTMKLRDGITFHDGEPFNAEAVVKGLQRAAVTGFIAQSLGDIAGAGAGKDPAGVGVKAIDDLTVEITTSRPWVTLPYYLTTQGSFAVSPKWYDAVFADPAAPNAEVGAQPVGTGPFKFVSWKPGDVLQVEKNPDYWRQDEAGNPLPYLDGIEFRVIPDELTRAKALEDGQLDFMPTDNAENIKKFRDSDFQFAEQAELGETLYVLLHVGQEGSPLQDRRVRCGLAAATNSEVLAEAIDQGEFPVANGPFSPGQQGYLEDTGYQAYDLDTAKQLISEYTAEKGKPTIKFSTVTDQTSLNTANLLQQWWSEAGVDVQVNQVEQQKLILDALLGDPNFNAFGWRNHAGLIVDGQYVWWHSKYGTPSGTPALNFGRLKDPVIDDLLDKAREEPDPAKQTEYAEQINQQFAKECWLIPTRWMKWGIVAAPEVKGISNSADHPAGGKLLDGAGFPGQVWFYNTWLDK